MITKSLFETQILARSNTFIDPHTVLQLQTYTMELKAERHDKNYEHDENYLPGKNLTNYR